MVTVGIGNEDLPVLLAGDQPYDLLHPAGIQLVEYVIKQQQGCRVTRRPFQETELRQLQGNHESLVLSLAAFTLHGIAALQHFQVVAVNAMQRIAHGTVFHTVALNHVQQGAPLAMRLIA